MSAPLTVCLVLVVVAATGAAFGATSPKARPHHARSTVDDGNDRVAFRTGHIGGATFAIPGEASTITTAGTGAFNVICPFTGNTGDIDPIVDPGVEPSAHLHQFFGSTTIDPDSTMTLYNPSSNPDGLIESGDDVQSGITGNTTCADKLDASGYWVPMTYEAGARMPAVPDTGITPFTAYYSVFKANYSTTPGSGTLGDGLTEAQEAAVDGLPPGLQFVVGNPSLESGSFAQQCWVDEAGTFTNVYATGCGLPQKGHLSSNLYWGCGSGKQFDGTEGFVPDCRAAGGPNHGRAKTTVGHLELHIDFPQCLELHQGVPYIPQGVPTPAAYTDNGVCPAAYPYPIVQLIERYRWDDNTGSCTFSTSGSNPCTAPDPSTFSVSSGCAAGPDQCDASGGGYWASMHADWINGWDPDELSMRITDCMVDDIKSDCGGASGQLDPDEPDADATEDTLGPSLPAVSRVGSATGDAVTTLQIPVTTPSVQGGTIYVAVASTVPETAVSVQDTEGNAYQAVGKAQEGGAGRPAVRLFEATHAWALTASDSVTVTTSTAAGLAATVDGVEGATGTQDGVAKRGVHVRKSAVSVGPLSTAAMNTVLYEVVAAAPAVSISAGAGWTATPVAASDQLQVLPEYRIVHTTGSFTATDRLSSPAAWCTVFTAEDSY